MGFSDGVRNCFYFVGVFFVLLFIDLITFRLFCLFFKYMDIIHKYLERISLIRKISDDCLVSQFANFDLRKKNIICLEVIQNFRNVTMDK